MEQGDLMGNLTDREIFSPFSDHARMEFKGTAPNMGRILLDRTEDGPRVLLQFDLGPPVPLEQVWVVHSPSGMEFGYPGSGPADLALNILRQFVEPPEAWALHQDMKREFIAPLDPDPETPHQIQVERIRAWIRGQWAARSRKAAEHADDQEPAGEPWKDPQHSGQGQT